MHKTKQPCDMASEEFTQVFTKSWANLPELLLAVRNTVLETSQMCQL